MDEQTRPPQETTAPETARQETAPPEAAQPETTAQPEAGIWDSARAEEFRQRWHEVQTRFVEDPPGSVGEARHLVDEAVQALADGVHARQEQLERGGARAADSTEGMRDTVLQYQHLLDRLLSV
jgi:hypothetical protein